ncbi:helix-turn-helix domain-containing protein [Mycobacterium sp. JS623]|uniref:helix-turn-helix domain-containing protein n=1 Tax=Mycobacterium sp. JS623 TaxID=212767 RepID=UPI0012F8353B|nr:helix-turn-helix domain-containing protein [Mycobacterium sp. JS623]
MTHTDENLTIEQAAAYLGVSTSWLYELRHQRRGPTSWRDGHRLVYPRSELDLFRARRRERTLRGEGVSA